MVDVQDLHFYRARVYKRGTEGDDRLQVRILPLMADIKDKEADNLPKFPCLFKGKVINCRQEKPTSETYNTNGKLIDSVETADYVCVICTDDFTFGYVLCLENQFLGYSGSNYVDSWGYPYLRDYINNRGLGDSDLKYEYLSVQEISSTDDGGYCEFFNWKNGNKYIINRSGSCIMILQDKVYIRAGSPGKNGAKNDFSAIEMSSDKVVIKTPRFEVDAKSIILGHHGQYLLSCSSSMVPVCAEGVNLQPIKSISV